MKFAYVGIKNQYFFVKHDCILNVGKTAAACSDLLLSHRFSLSFGWLIL